MKNPNLTRVQVEYYLKESEGKLKDLKNDLKELKKDIKWYEDEIAKMKADLDEDAASPKK